MLRRRRRGVRLAPLIDVVFIRHHVTAQEVPEEDFFTARETGQ